jgi:hypothetical protein
MATRQPSPDAYVWRQGRSEVVLQRAGDNWHIRYTVAGRLLGPRQAVYEARHQSARLAAWDFMARVVRASHDEEEAVRASQEAARWMRGLGAHDQPAP